jgi:hypothetical protein
MFSLTILEDIIRRYILTENGHQFFNDLKSQIPIEYAFFQGRLCKKAETLYVFYNDKLGAIGRRS